MHWAYVAIDPDVLRRLYVEERQSADEIARRLRCSAATILRRLSGFGIRTRRRGPIPIGGMSGAPIQWTADIAYGVGLMATDGNLSRDGRHMTFTSKDADLIETLRRCFCVSARIATTTRDCHRVQWCDRGLYDWFLAIGLTPAKSLTLGPLAVPHKFAADFFRGCIDGDGSITTYVDRYNTFKKAQYVYTRLYLSLVSASPTFVGWVREVVRGATGCSGDMGVRRSTKHNDVWRLRYAKAEALALLRWMYYEPDVPCLRRKRDIAAAFLIPRERPAHRGPGRPMVV